MNKAIISGTDQYGNYVEEVVDMDESLEEMLERRFGRKIPVIRIIVAREGEYYGD